MLTPSEQAALDALMKKRNENAEPTAEEKMQAEYERSPHQFVVNLAKRVAELALHVAGLPPVPAPVTEAPASKA